MYKLTYHLSALKFFIVAGRSHSFSEAAKKLNVTQSAVSHQIRKLESLLGVSLFERMPDGVSLTREGEIYLEKISEAFTLISNATDVIRGNSAHRELIINSLPSFSASWLVPRLSQFNYLHPDILITLQNSISPLDASMASFHAAIRVGPAPGKTYPSHAARIDLKIVESWKDVDCYHIADDRLVPILPKSIDSDKISNPKTLVKMPLIHNGNRPRAWYDWAKYYEVSVSKYGETYGHFFLAIQACRQGRGVALIPDILLNNWKSNEFRIFNEFSIRSKGDYMLIIPCSYNTKTSAIDFKKWIMSQIPH